MDGSINYMRVVHGARGCLGVHVTILQLQYIYIFESVPYY